jgi:hypothetical protein
VAIFRHDFAAGFGLDGLFRPSMVENRAINRKIQAKCPFSHRCSRNPKIQQWLQSGNNSLNSVNFITTVRSICVRDK